MAESGIGFLLVLTLRGFLVLSEFSLVNLRYSEVNEATLADLRKHRGIVPPLGQPLSRR